ETQDARRLRELILMDGMPVPPELDAFLESAPQYPISDTQSLLSPLTSLLSPLSNHFSSQSTLLDERARQLHEEAESLEREIRQLRTGDREASYQSEAPQAVRLQQLIRAQLGLQAGEVVFLAEALHIPDESWQNAVEGVLGRSRFTLLVPPTHYAAAMQLYRERRHKDGLHGVGLLDTERLLADAHPRGAAPTSLAAEVNTTHPAARAFVDLLLGNIVKCDSLEALRDHRTAITREAFLRRNYTTTHLNPHVYRRWFIGERATPRQVEQRQARLEEIAGEMLTLHEQSAALRERLALTREKIRPLLSLEHALPELIRLPTLTAERDTCRAELAALDTQAIVRLQAEVERRKGESNRLYGENAALERRIGGLENQVKTLAGETLPALEREADRALQSAREFLTLETGTDAADPTEILTETEKEYERRRERQPLETVLQNATRYENDYQSAEMRSRDQLREAKQAYSLRYDFGYDDDENAARYLAERDKLVQSELPQYEARIAAQRSQAEQELVENFIHRLREQIEEARQQLTYLNATLVHLKFGGERFEFITQPAPVLREVYDMVMDSQNILGDSLFESNFRQKHQKGWDLLFERLTAHGPDTEEALVLEMRELQDYRNYLEYDIRIHYPNGDRALLSKINAKKSGGETTTPFYVAMAASFAQAYRLNQPRPSDTIRLAMFDEAFGKMDTARTASALQFMRETGLQVLLATPPDKSGALLEYVDCVRTVVRKNGHAFVIEIDKAEMLKELEGR
ncbi:MAG TPA: SbcC/MukB-like Walker B domain-containing protein, partial [Anaerolineales bacterium]|nr:SbcC/MukB-like Walker B domain-containing protein [Anaerolineales bacterium]